MTIYKQVNQSFVTKTLEYAELYDDKIQETEVSIQPLFR